MVKAVQQRSRVFSSCAINEMAITMSNSLSYLSQWSSTTRQGAVVYSAPSKIRPYRASSGNVTALSHATSHRWRQAPPSTHASTKQSNVMLAPASVQGIEK